jgi:hypothetical protein
MTEVTRAITWEAPEPEHKEKGSDWFWALGIVAIAGSAAAVLFSNTLFAVVVLLGASTMIVFAHRKPKILEYAVTTRGIRIHTELYPYSTLECFYLDEDCPTGPQLLIQSQKLFMPLLILPIPSEYIDDIDDLLSAKLPEEHLDEPFAHRLLEFFGF